MKYVHLDIENTGYKFLKRSNIVKEIKNSQLTVYYNNSTKQVVKNFKQDMTEFLEALNINIKLSKTEKLVKKQVTDISLLEKVSNNKKALIENTNVILTRDIDLINKFAEIFKGTDTPIKVLEHGALTNYNIVDYNPKDFASTDISVSIELLNKTLYSKVTLLRDKSSIGLVNLKDLQKPTIPIQLQIDDTEETIYKLSYKESTQLRNKVLEIINRAYINDTSLVLTNGVSIPIIKAYENRILIDSDLLLNNKDFLIWANLIEDIKGNIAHITNKLYKPIPEEIEPSSLLNFIVINDTKEFKPTLKVTLTPFAVEGLDCSLVNDTILFSHKELEGWEITCEDKCFTAKPITEEAREVFLCHVNNLLKF